MFLPLTIVLTRTSRGIEGLLRLRGRRADGQDDPPSAESTPRAPIGRTSLVEASLAYRSLATVIAKTPTAPASMRGLAQAPRLAPVVTTPSTRIIQRPA